VVVKGRGQKFWHGVAQRVELSVGQDDAAFGVVAECHDEKADLPIGYSSVEQTQSGPASAMPMDEVAGVDAATRTTALAGCRPK
jgi:hypothetical protein